MKDAIIDVLIVLLGILLISIILTAFDLRDQELKNKELTQENIQLKLPRIVTCKFKQNMEIIEYPGCLAIDQKYAQLNY
jgi:uncharacterized alpha/beta hydrolase family protein